MARFRLHLRDLTYVAAADVLLTEHRKLEIGGTPALSVHVGTRGTPDEAPARNSETLDVNKERCSDVVLPSFAASSCHLRTTRLHHPRED